MNSDDILYLPAYKLRELFLKKELSPVEVMKLSLQRAEVAQEKCNCLTQIFDKMSLVEAKKSEDNYMKGQARGLEGIPLLLKSEAELKGSKQDFASNLHRGGYDKGTDIHVERLLSAGAVPMAKSTIPEFSLLGLTYSDLHGVTTNPWHDYFSPGGSSGGSGAGLAMGIAPLATGSDIGGSIRIPASWSGIVGFKPPYGRVPQAGPWGLDYYCHMGPMTRSVKDIAMMMEYMAGIDFRDAASVNEKVNYTMPEGEVSLKGVKIAMVVDWGKIYDVDEQVEANMRAVAKTYEDLGAEVVEMDIALPEDFLYLTMARTAHSSGALTGEVVKDKKLAKLLTDYGREWGAFANTTTGLDYFKGEQMTSAIAEKFAVVFQKYDAILTPMATKVGVKADGDTLKFKKIRENGPMGSREKWILPERYFIGALFNSQSRCPVVAMPSGFASVAADKKKGIAAGRMPTGVQLAGRPFHDAEVLKLALAYERTQHWYRDKAYRPI